MYLGNVPLEYARKKHLHTEIDIKSLKSDIPKRVKSGYVPWKRAVEASQIGRDAGDRQPRELHLLPLVRRVRHQHDELCVGGGGVCLHWSPCV